LHAKASSVFYNLNLWKIIMLKKKFLYIASYILVLLHASSVLCS